MDKIYSRKRINLPKVNLGKFSNKRENIRLQRRLKITIVLIIAVLAMVMVISFINPIIDELCIDASKKKATLISNRKATEVMSNYTYEDMVTIYRDADNNITMLKSNIIVINEIISSVAEEIQKEFEKDSESKISLRLRKFNWVKVFFWSWS